MTHPLAGRTCTVVGGEAIGVRGVVVDGYAGLLGTPVGLGRNRVGPTSEMVYVIVFEVTHVPSNLPRDYIGHLFSVRATQVQIDPAHPDWAYKTPSAAQMALSACRKIYDSSNGGDSIRFAGGLQRDEYGAGEAFEAAIAAAKEWK